MPDGYYLLCHLSIVVGLVVRHGDLSHEMTLSHEGHRPECDKVNRVLQIPCLTTFMQQLICYHVDLL